MEQRYHTYLPGWEILEPPIGSGGFSTVYEIVRTDEFGMEEHAALKVISVPENKSDITAFRDDGLDDKSITAYFKTQVDDISKEFFLLSGMKGNSHIVSYEDHQIVQHDNDPGWDILIRMELLASLTDYYRANFANTAIDEMTVIKIGVDLCKALELCEKKNIIHRDIKPQNIFVNQNGDFKLGDFGIARVSDHTTKATKAGTYTYMAPEVYLGRSYNARVDQYSLGLVLYWLLNERRMPFAPQGVPTADDNSKALQRRMNGERIPEPLHGSPELKKIVLRACAFDPNERFSGPMEMRLALEIIAHGGLARWFPGEIPVGLKREKRPKPEPVVNLENGNTVGKYSASRQNNQVKKICRIVFQDEDENVLSEREYAEGETFEVPRLQDKEDAQYFYPFAGWKPKLESTTVTKNVTYTAQYGQIKKKKRWLLPVACGAAALVVAAVCILGWQIHKLNENKQPTDYNSDSEPSAMEEIEPSDQEEQGKIVLESLKMSSDALTLFIGREAQLSVSTTPSKYPVEWGSSNTSVVSVDQTGLVTAKSAGTASISAAANGKSVTCQITVEDKEITSITLDSSSAKTEYFVGETFDAAGLKASVKYNTGDEESVSSGFTGELDSSAAGKATVTVYYGGEQAGTYSVMVKKAEVSSIRIVKLPNTALTEGESLGLSGLEIEAVFSDGSTKNIYAGDSALSCSPTTFKSTGAQTVTVSYGGQTTTFTVQIAPIDRYVVSLSSSNNSYGTVSGGGTFKKGETATLVVVPSEGCQFDAWSDDSTQTRRTIMVEENVSLTAYFYGPLVDYTPEGEIPQNAVKVGNAKKQYQYQKKEYTTSSQSTLDGWTVYDSTYTWSDYGPFGEWTDLGNGVITGEDQKLERRKIYRYYYFLCNNCGAHMHGYGNCYTWAGGCGGKIYESDYYVVWAEKSYSEAGDWHGTGVSYVYTDEGLGFAYTSASSRYYEQPKEQYRIASRQKIYTYSFYRYGTPYWSDSQVSSDDVKLVSTRLLYRYRLR